MATRPQPFSILKTLSVPVLLTVAAVAIMWKTSSDTLSVIILLVIVFTWGLAGLLLGRQTGDSRSLKSIDEKLTLKPSLAPISQVSIYYVNLLTDFQRHTWSLDQQRVHTLNVFSRMSQHLNKAADLSKSTGLLAANAMLAAARCGEVGRGFVTVSRDLAGISDRSETDLQKLSNLVTRLYARLSMVPGGDQPVIRLWLDAQTFKESMPWDPQILTDLDEYLAFASQTVQELQDRYQDDTRLDVRWLQLGDAVRRVLIDLGDNLFNLRQSIEKVLAEWRILSISQPLDEAQLTELKKYFDSFGGHSSELI